MKPLRSDDYIFREEVPPWATVIDPRDIDALNGHDEDVMTPEQRREHRRSAARKNRG